jgi:glycosyltransferase involved in cell wall biosynthesis
MITLSVLIPVFNEENTILKVLAAVAAQSLPGVKIETVVVDDASTDNTPAILKDCSNLYTRLVTLERNSGKGAAIIAALRVATGDYVLVQDADLEYSPDDYAKLVKPVLDLGAELVIGSRFLAPTWTRVNYFWHKVGNRIITVTFNLLNNTTFTDVYSGFILFRATLVSPSELVCAGWAQQAEILGKACARTRTIYEVAINYSGRSYEEGKKIRAYHALPVIWTILHERVKRLFKTAAR